MSSLETWAQQIQHTPLTSGKVWVLLSPLERNKPIWRKILVLLGREPGDGNTPEEVRWRNPVRAHARQAAEVV